MVFKKQRTINELKLKKEAKTLSQFATLTERQTLKGCRRKDVDNLTYKDFLFQSS